MKLLNDYKKTAMIYDSVNISYREVMNYSLSYANYIKDAPNNKIAVFTSNRPELSYSIFGIWQREYCAVTIDASSDKDELVYVLKDSKPSYIYSELSKKDIVEEAIKEANIDCKGLYFEELDLVEVDEEIKEPREDIEALILYTSGTTGDPKGVVLTFKNLYYQIKSLNKFNMYEEKDVYLALLPLHHIFPLMGTLIVPLINGGTIVFLKELNGDSIMKALKDYKVTFFCGVPRLYELLYKGIMKKVEANKVSKIVFNLAKKIKSRNIKMKLFKKVQEGFGGNIKFLVSGGAKLDEDIAIAFDTFGFKVIEGYGLTETSPMISFTRPNMIKLGSAGHVLEGLDVKLDNDGVLCVKGDNVFKEYLNKEELTKEVFDKEGYFVTGDLARVEDDGRLYILGRKKEMIVLSNGKNINPADIEEEIFSLANGLIEELAVVDFENSLNLVVKPNLKLVEKEKISNILETIKWSIVDKYNTKAPKYKKILNIKIVNTELPKTKLGKLRRFKLKDLLEGKEEKRKDIVEPNTNEYKDLKSYLEETSKKWVYPDSHIELDLGLDSLDIVELFAYLNTKFGVNIDERIFSKNSTVEKLSEYIISNKGELSFNSSIIDLSREYQLPKSSKVLGVLKSIFSPIFKGWFGVEVEGLNNLQDENVIYVGNHSSFLDAFIFVEGLKREKLKDTYFMAKVKHFKSPMMKWLGNNSNVIVMDINENLRDTLSKCAYALKNKKSLVIFPEGVRSRDGEINEFKKSFALLSKEMDVKVVSFVIKGAFESMPHGKIIPRKRKLKIKFLEAIKNDDIDALTIEAMNSIKKELAE